MIFKCVFCDMDCEEAPTERGSLQYGPGKAIHFECIEKLWDTYNAYLKAEEIKFLGFDKDEESFWCYQHGVHYTDEKPCVYCERNKCRR